MSVQIMIYAYLAVCACMIIYNIVCIFVFRKNEKNAVIKSAEMEEKIREQLRSISEKGHIDLEHINYVEGKCSNEMNLLAFDGTVAALTKELPDEMHGYIGELGEAFSYLAPIYQKKDNTLKSYYAYVIKRSKILSMKRLPVVEEILMDMVRMPNQYCRENALEAIYTAGDIDLVVNAIRIVEMEKHFHHEKLIIDGLLSFTGDREKLADALLSVRSEFSPLMQRNIMDFARYLSGTRCELMYNIMADSKEDDEVRFAAMRYFAKYKYPEAYETLIYFAEHPSDYRWEYPAVACTTLSNYKNDRTIAVLKKCLSHSNWYIRYNAAVSLESFGMTYMELADVLDGNDRYAREVLQYRMDARKNKMEMEAKKA